MFTSCYPVSDPNVWKVTNCSMRCSEHNCISRESLIITGVRWRLFESVTDALIADGKRPYSIPIGGSTAVGALGYVAGYLELSQQLMAKEVDVSAVVHTSSSGGTHAGLVAGQAVCRAIGMPAPSVIAVGVAKGVVIGSPDVTTLANEALSLLPNCPPGSSLRRQTLLSTATGWAMTMQFQHLLPTMQFVGLLDVVGGCSIGFTQVRVCRVCWA